MDRRPIVKILCDELAGAQIFPDDFRLPEEKFFRQLPLELGKGAAVAAIDSPCGTVE